MILFRELINENDAKIVKQVQKLVNTLNSLIEKAVDEVRFKWVMLYSPNKIHTDTITKQNLEFDGIPNLRTLIRLYKQALKKHGISA